MDSIYLPLQSKQTIFASTRIYYKNVTITSLVVVSTTILRYLSFEKYLFYLVDFN